MFTRLFLSENGRVVTIDKTCDIIFLLIFFTFVLQGGVANLEHSGSNQKEDTGLTVSICFNAFLLAVVLFLLW